MTNEPPFKPQKRSIVYLVLGALVLIGIVVVTTPFAAHAPSIQVSHASNH